MRNAIDVESFYYNEAIRKEIRNSLNIKQNQLVIGHIGRFIPEKNQIFLLDIFDEVNKQCPNSRLLLIGRGKPEAEIKYKEKVKKKVREMGLESKVRFLGVRDDVEKLMQGIDILVMPSLSEGFPVTLVEAQSADIPCVVSDVVSNEVNISGKIQYKSLMEDPIDWANKILSFAQANTGREDMRKRIIQSGLDIKENAGWLEEFYENVSF